MNRIKELRQARQWRQVDLAKALNTTMQTISRYEKEDRGLDVETIHKLCDMFGCTADYLLGRSALPAAELSPEEQALLLAFRRCDGRARDMVLLALEPFREKGTDKAAI